MDETTLLDTPAASQAGYGDSSNLFSVIDRDRQVTFLGVLVDLLFLLFTTIFDWVFEPLFSQNLIKKFESNHHTLLNPLCGLCYRLATHASCLRHLLNYAPATNRVNGLNLTIPEDAKELIKPWDMRESTEKFVDSGVDDQVSEIRHRLRH
jgi:hypothetical protein